MGHSIDDYRRKRDFGRTPEPPPAAAGARGPEPVFVVHRHDASRLHYDLRLEMDGVLRSWAVPRGFSYDPGDKHLAIRTEDHPLAYEHFAGVIPEGQYGAGTMTIWDRGVYEVVHAASAPEAVASGELKVILRGRKLRGEWHVVKTQQGERDWLLFKSRDRYAGPSRDSVLGIDLDGAPRAALPRRVEPMTVGVQAAAFSDPAWLFEMRFTGLRTQVRKDGDAVHVAGVRVPAAEIQAAALGLRAERALLDGVLVIPDDDGRPSASLLEERLAGASDRALSFYAFDLLHFDEFDLRPLPLVDRKGALRAIMPPSAHLLFVDHVPGSGHDLVAAVGAAGLPGVVAKRANSRYQPGPSEAWCGIAVAPTASAAGLGVGEALARLRPAPACARVAYTNLEKVYWPAEGFTKGDLVAYYERVADLLLPYLRDRPLHMNRHPDGIEGKSFYQKNVGDMVPAWVATAPVGNGDEEQDGDEARYVICNDVDTLRWLANLGSIDLHPWMSRWESLDVPDYAVIDLDPKEAPFQHVIEIARVTGEILRDLGLSPLLKTSGATGLHIHVPLAGGYRYEQTRMFCEAVARLVARDLRAIATVERALGKRGGRVYVDFGQNRRGQTIVPPYVVRPVRGATVSTPLRWSELTDDLHPSQFTIQTVLPRFEREGDLFAPLLTDGRDLLPAIEALGRRMGR